MLNHIIPPRCTKCGKHFEAGIIGSGADIHGWYCPDCVMKGIMFSGDEFVIRKKVIYLAGPILHCSDRECKTWRQIATDRLCGHYLIHNPLARNYRFMEGPWESTIVCGDKSGIDCSDILLVNHSRVSVGTSMEMLYGYERGKNIITIIPEGMEVSPWLVYHTTTRVKTLEEAISHLLLLA